MHIFNKCPDVVSYFHIKKQSNGDLLGLFLLMKLDYIIKRSPKLLHKFIMYEVYEVAKAVKRELKKTG